MGLPLFTEEQEMYRQSLRRFIDSEILPNVQHWEEEKICERSIFEKMGKLGFIGPNFPSEYGGGGMDFWSAVIFSQEIAYANCGGLAMSLFAHTYLPLPLINAIGTEDQKQNYLKPALQGQKICGLAITEPSGGSDVGGMKTFAKDMGDHYLINGSKMWITNGTLADFIVLSAKTGEGYDLTLFIFDTKTPGFQAIPVKHKLGMHTSDTSQLFFENCKVPKTAVLGMPSMGFYYLMNNIQEERLIAAVMSTFSAEWAFEKAKKYSRERESFGKPLAKFQVIRHKLSEMAVSLEACKALTFEAIHQFMANGSTATKVITIAKLFATENSIKIIDEALQIHGGWGYMEEYGLARAWRDARLTTIGAGTSEIMHEIISKLVIDEVQHERQLLR
ncbi:MAG: acyl-CoA dehydrogenase family protein [Bacteroidia bacterium]|nr:acyl-CoA dehydrogenase family protein [Bacteroidia bacterium]